MEMWTTEERRAFGARLRTARKAKGMTLVELGALFDKTKQAVSHWETGRSVPSVEDVAICATEFRVSVEWLVTGRDVWPFAGDVSPAEVASLPPDLLIEAKGMLRTLLAMAKRRDPTLEPESTTPALNGKQRRVAA